VASHPDTIDDETRDYIVNGQKEEEEE
jgi:hypothetical protein